MKRPEVKNYSNNIDFPENYLSDLEKYCDELETQLNKIKSRVTFDSILKLEEELKKCNFEYMVYKSALNIACELLEEGYGQEYANYEYITYDDKLVNIPANMKANQWYEFLLKGGK